MEDTKDRLEVDDKNADGFVTWEEFTESTYGMSEEELAELQETGGESENAQKKMAKVTASHSDNVCVFKF